MIRIREKRRAMGMTMKELGRLVGVSEAAISHYETGRREPDPGMLKRIADVLGVTTDYLLSRESNSPKWVKVESSVNEAGSFRILSNTQKPAKRSPEAQAIIDEIMAKVMAIPDDAKIQVLNFADFIKAQEDSKK